MTESRGWPTAPILLWGTFGKGSAAGRKYHFRAGMALVVALSVALLTVRLRWLAPVSVFMPAATLAYIGWEFRKYLSGLDELGRRIHMEAICLTYLTALVLIAAAGGYAALAHINVNPIWLVLIEPIRAGWLWLTARRYS